MNNYCVYEHLFPNGKRYIGVTSTKPETRWRNGEGYKTQTKIAKAIKHYGWDNVQHNIIVDNLTKEQAANLEKYLIASLNTIDNGYNIAIGGENINTCYLDEYVLAMLRYAKSHDITCHIKFTDGEIDLVKFVDGDKKDKLAAEMWNDASKAVKRKHKEYSPTTARDVSEFWWYMAQYYELWLLMETGKNVDDWEEETYERMMLDWRNVCKY